MIVKTVKASGGDYSSLSAFEAAAAATLTDIYAAACDNFKLTDQVAFSGITTTSSFYVYVYADTGAQHDGRSRDVSGTGFQLDGTSGFTALRIAVQHIRFENFDVRQVDGATNPIGFNSFTSGSDVRCSNMIFHDTKTGTAYTVSASQANLNLTLTNCIIYGYQRSIDTRNATSVVMNNCTTWRHADQLGIVSDTELVAKNTYSGKASGSQEDFWTAGAAPSGNNNASSDNSVLTDYTASIGSIAGSSVFISTTPGAEDFRLKSGTNALVDAGATLTYAFDNIGTVRPQGSAWDIGASERLASGYALSLSTGEYDISGGDVIVTVERQVVAGNGAYAISGGDLGVVVHRALALGNGAYSISGGDVDIEINSSTTINLDLATGTFSLSGGDLAPQFTRQLALGTGEFDLSGGDLSVVVGRKLDLGNGAFALSGGPLNIAANRKLAVATGQFAYSGGDLVAVVHRALALGVGEFDIAGGDLGIVVNIPQINVDLSTGTFNISGGPLSINRRKAVSLSTGTFNISGGNLKFTGIPYRVDLAVGQFSFTGGGLRIDRPTIIKPSDLEIKASGVAALLPAAVTTFILTYFANNKLLHDQVQVDLKAIKDRLDAGGL